MLRLKQIIKERGLTQSKIAEAMKVSTVSVSQWASGKSIPSLKSLVKLTEILGVTLDELVISEKRKKPSKKYAQNRF